MAGTDDKAMTSPSFCKNGCGFYGSPNTEGLCSKCFRDMQKDDAGSVSVNTATSCRTETAAAMGPSIPLTASINQSNTAMEVTSMDSGAMEPMLTSSPQSITVAGMGINTSDMTPAMSSCDNRLGTNESSENASTAAAVVDTNRISDTAPEDANAAATSGNGPSIDSTSSTQSKSTKPRCNVCKKKLGLTGMSCRCGGLYCSLHRYPTDHACSYDYKTEGQNALRLANPKVDGEKITKI